MKNKNINEIMDNFEQILMYPLYVDYWPTLGRRIFILTLPISGLIWILYSFLFLLCVVIVLFVYKLGYKPIKETINAIKKLWKDDNYEIN